MFQQRIRKSLNALFGPKDFAQISTESRIASQEYKRITREDLDAMTTQELNRRALYESLAEHQRLIEADEKADRLWQD